MNKQPCMQYIMELIETYLSQLIVPLHVLCCAFRCMLAVRCVQKQPNQMRIHNLSKRIVIECESVMCIVNMFTLYRQRSANIAKPTFEGHYYFIQYIQHIVRLVITLY